MAAASDGMPAAAAGDAGDSRTRVFRVTAAPGEALDPLPTKALIGLAL